MSTATHESRFGPEYQLAHHFHDPQQQFDTGKFGMWAFLVTEILFFSALFVAYAVFRSTQPELFSYAAGYLDPVLGGVNTVVLIFSSLTMAWAVRCAQLNQIKGLKLCLAITLLCAAAFMVIKGFEYTHKIHIGLFPSDSFGATEDPAGFKIGSPQAEAPPENLRTFFGVYFCMTALHGLHVLIGMGVITWLLIRAMKGHFSSKYFGPVDFTALYWHIVDLIWIFLFPLLYLIH